MPIVAAAADPVRKLVGSDQKTGRNPFMPALRQAEHGDSEGSIILHYGSQKKSHARYHHRHGCVPMALVIVIGRPTYQQHRRVTPDMKAARSAG